MPRSNNHLHANLTKDNKKRQILIKQLMKVWSSKDVEQNYQNYFLNYLDSLPDHVVQIEITRQIKKTTENRNHYFNTNKSLALHNTSIAKLRLSIENVERKEKISERDLEEICYILDELRNNNILVAQNTLKFNYEQRNVGIDEFELLNGNFYIFQKINNDHGFIKNSFLRKFIQFTHAYDPFFLYHYETAKNGLKDREFKSLPCIEKLFNLSVSKAYKIIKLQQEIMAIMAGKATVDRDLQRSRRRKRYSFQVVSDRNKYSTTIVNQYNHNESVKIENKAYLQRKEEIEPYQSPILIRSKTDVDENTNFNERLQKSTIRRIVYNLAPIPKRESINTIDQKISFTQMPDNLLFKSRNRQIQSLKESIGRSYKVGSIRFSGTRKREDEYRKILPFRHYNPIPVKEEYLRSKSIEMPDKLEENDLHRNQPLQKKKNNFNFHNYNAIPVVKQQNNIEIQPDVGLQLKSFKMKAGNLTVNNLFTFLKELNINQKYRNIFQVGNWDHSIRNNQYYLHKHYINQVLQAVSLCCALPETDIVIKYWGPTIQCDEQTSQFLFKKLLEHIQRHTLCKYIYYNAVQMPEIYSSNFIKHKDRIYRKQRSLPMQIEYFSYYPFLSIDLSIISIPRNTSTEIQDNITVPSNVYSPFTQNEFVCLNYLLIINRLVNPGEFSKLGSFTPELESMREVQTRMLKEELTCNPFNLNSEACPINLLTFRMRNPIFSAFFVANKPLLKFTGQQVYRDNQRKSIIVALKMLKSNTRVLFGKGFKNAMQMASILKTHNKGYKNIEFCVYMFAKRLRGRIKSIHLPDQICFGDLQLVFEWKDFLKGRLEHDLSQLGTFGYNRETFFCMVQIYNENIFAVEINQSNFI